MARVAALLLLCGFWMLICFAQHEQQSAVAQQPAAATQQLAVAAHEAAREAAREAAHADQQPAASVQQPAAAAQEEQASPELPVVQGWRDLVTTASTTFSWSHQLLPGGPTSLAVGWGDGGASTTVRAALSRSVASAAYTLSGGLQLLNADPQRPVRVARVQLRCLWGAYLELPCGNTGGWLYGPLVIGPGQETTCWVGSLSLPAAAAWGSGWRQPCTAVATLPDGREASSGDFVLDFGAPTRDNQANNCAVLSVDCALAAPGGARYFPDVHGAGLPQGRWLCDAQPQGIDFSVEVSGGFVGDGTEPGSCGSPARVTCTSRVEMQSTVGAAPGPASGPLASSLDILVTPVQCPAPAVPLPPPPPPPPPPPRGFYEQPALEPVLGISVARTLLVGTFAWDVRSAVRPGQLELFPGASSEARYTVNATRRLSAGPPSPRYLVEGSVTARNPHGSQPLAISSLEAVLPWGEAAAITACGGGFSLPGTLPPGGAVSCSFLLQHPLGPEPGVVAAQAQLPGRSTPVRSATGAAFDFAAPDLRWTTGACAGVIMAFAADPRLSLLALAGGTAPAFAGSGKAPTEVCAPGAGYSFVAEVTAGGDMPQGEYEVATRTTVAPTTGGQAAAESSTRLSVQVLDWPADWDPQASLAAIQAKGPQRTAPAAPPERPQRIPLVPDTWVAGAAAQLPAR